ncbi:10218_t:CDS:2, partial [Gigaspora margarita]
FIAELDCEAGSGSSVSEIDLNHLLEIANKKGKANKIGKASEIGKAGRIANRIVKADKIFDKIVNKIEKIVLKLYRTTLNITIQKREPFIQEFEKTIESIVIKKLNIELIEKQGFNKGIRQKLKTQLVRNKKREIEVFCFYTDGSLRIEGKESKYIVCNEDKKESFNHLMECTAYQVSWKNIEDIAIEATWYKLPKEAQKKLI